jgi:SAM-dependent methyltransferase
MNETYISHGSKAQMEARALNKITHRDLDEFVNICASITEIDKEIFIDEVKQLYKWHDNGEVPKRIKSLQDKWYKSLMFDNPDFSVYDDAYYLADCWACWKIYSRKYLKSIADSKALGFKDSHRNYHNARSVVDDIGEIRSVVDVGCGIGYSTLAIKEIFPMANVYGTNIDGTKQWDLCKKLGVELRADIEEISQADLVVAFEYFEHFQDPVEHLKQIVETLQPKYFLIASSFGTTSIGHFISQKYNNKIVVSKGFGRIFNRELRKMGYTQQPTNIYNHKPSYWEKTR